MDSKTLEAFLINTKSNSVSDSEIRNSSYYTMPDRELANLLIEVHLQNFMIQLATKNDPQVNNLMMFLRASSAYYYEYNISGYPVVTTKRNKNDREATFTIYAFIPKSNKMPKATGYTKSELIRQLILNDRKRIANEAISADKTVARNKCISICKTTIYKLMQNLLTSAQQNKRVKWKNPKIKCVETKSGCKVVLYDIYDMTTREVFYSEDVIIDKIFNKLDDHARKYEKTYIEQGIEPEVDLTTNIDLNKNSVTYKLRAI